MLSAWCCIARTPTQAAGERQVLQEGKTVKPGDIIHFPCHLVKVDRRLTDMAAALCIAQHVAAVHVNSLVRCDVRSSSAGSGAPSTATVGAWGINGGPKTPDSGGGGEGCLIHPPRAHRGSISILFSAISGKTLDRRLHLLLSLSGGGEGRLQGILAPLRRLRHLPLLARRRWQTRVELDFMVDSAAERGVATTTTATPGLVSLTVVTDLNAATTWCGHGIRLKVRATRSSMATRALSLPVLGIAGRRLQRPEHRRWPAIKSPTHRGLMREVTVTHRLHLLVFKVTLATLG